jgi:hypothetical protein
MKLFIAATLVSAAAAFSSREAISMGYLSDISPPAGYAAPKSYSPFGSGMPKAGKDTSFQASIGLPAAAPVAAAPAAPAQAFSTAPVGSAPAPKSYAPWGKKPASAGGAAATASAPTYSSSPASPAAAAKSYR